MKLTGFSHFSSPDDSYRSGCDTIGKKRRGRMSAPRLGYMRGTGEPTRNTNPRRKHRFTGLLVGGFSSNPDRAFWLRHGNLDSLSEARQFGYVENG